MRFMRSPDLSRGVITLRKSPEAFGGDVRTSYARACSDKAQDVRFSSRLRKRKHVHGIISRQHHLVTAGGVEGRADSTAWGQAFRTHAETRFEGVRRAAGVDDSRQPTPVFVGGQGPRLWRVARAQNKKDTHNEKQGQEKEIISIASFFKWPDSRDCFWAGWRQPAAPRRRERPRACLRV